MSKKLVQINVVCNGSTGRIMNQIQNKAQNHGWEAYSFYGRGKPSNENCFKIGNKFDVLFHVLITRIFDKHGHGSKRATKKLVKRIEKINPDVIQLHNIHGYYIHLETLFNYLKKCNSKIVWTLHDCWAFTGHCSHFTYPKCEKWKEGCSKCIRKKDYPKSVGYDSSKKEYEFKKKLFTGIKNLTLVTPSNWLDDLVKQSFLKEYEVKVINNGIDLNAFKSTNTINVKEKYNIPRDKKIILGVSSVWNEKKGLNEFYKLADLISGEYRIILVGLNEKQIKKLPKNIIGIKRTENMEELANIYTIADVFFNPSREETFSLVTVESMACGTPALVYDDSATKELVPDFIGEIKSGDKDIQEIKESLEKIIEQESKTEELQKYVADKFNIHNKIKEYINYYQKEE